MKKTILQVPLDKQLKNNAEKIASEQGFSSLQEIVRVFLTQLASKRVEISLQESQKLSDRNESRYLKLTQDFESGQNISSAQNVDDLLKKLNEN